MSLPNRPTGFIAPASQVPTLQVGSTTGGLIAVGAQTEGRFGLFRWDMSAISGKATPHYHRTFAESFFVLEGEVMFYEGTAWQAGTPGDFVYIPPEGVHGFRNDSGAPASMLILFSPAPPREDYFRELAERIASGVEFSDAERTEFMARHDQYEVDS